MKRIALALWGLVVVTVAILCLALCSPAEEEPPAPMPTATLATTQPTTTAPTIEPTTTRPKTDPADQEETRRSIYYANCKEAQAEGAAPL